MQRESEKPLLYTANNEQQSSSLAENELGNPSYESTEPNTVYMFLLFVTKGDACTYSWRSSSNRVYKKCAIAHATS